MTMTATAHALRQARMEFKTTTDMKELLSQAAALDGLDLTSFVLGSAIEKARQVLSQHTSIALARKARQAWRDCSPSRRSLQPPCRNSCACLTCLPARHEGRTIAL